MANFAEIVEIVAPDSAAQGSHVDVTVKVKNIWGALFYVICVAWANTLLIIDWVEVLVEPDNVHDFQSSFIMGDGDVEIHAETWYESGGNLYKDDEKTKNISVVTDGMVDAFKELEITSYGRA